MKKFTLLLAFLAVCLSGMANSQFHSGFFNCTIIDNESKTVKIKKFTFGTHNSEELIIPSKVSNEYFEYTVVEIENNAFKTLSVVTSLTIPSCVNTIGDNAFSGCSNLTSVTFEGTKTTLGDDVFSGCTNLTEVHIPDYASDDFKNYILSKLPSGTTEAIFQTFSVKQLVEGEEYTYTEEQTTSIRYCREFDSENWQALFLPFELTFYEWKSLGQVAELTGYDANDNTLTWTEKSSGNIAAGTPVIFKPNLNGESKVTLDIEGTKSLVENTTFHNVTAGTGEDQVTLSGTYAKMDMSSTTGIDEGMCYWGLSHGDFYYTNNSEKKLKPYRIYLIAQNPSSPSSAPMRINIVGSGTTEIETVDIEEIFETPAFNLNGHRVGSDYKGIVIQNGKKVLRK